MISNSKSLLTQVLLGAVMPLVAVVGCGHASSPVARAATSQPSSPTVSIDNFSFTPTAITVPAGTTVTWVNHDDVPHTVTANDKVFSSGALDTDERYSHAFAIPGTYSYFCAVHTHMTGQVIVK